MRLNLRRDTGVSMDTRARALAPGGNSTAIGASANSAVLGIVAGNGLSVSCLEFLTVRTFVLFVTVAIGTAFLRLNFAVP